jgi:hypothetical protein
MIVVTDQSKIDERKNTDRNRRKEYPGNEDARGAASTNQDQPNPPGFSQDAMESFHGFVASA